MTITITFDSCEQFGFNKNGYITDPNKEVLVRDIESHGFEYVLVSVKNVLNKSFLKAFRFPEMNRSVFVFDGDGGIGLVGNFLSESKWDDLKKARVLAEEFITRKIREQAIKATYALNHFE